MSALIAQSIEVEDPVGVAAARRNAAAAAVPARPKPVAAAAAARLDAFDSDEDEVWSSSARLPPARKPAVPATASRPAAPAARAPSGAASRASASAGSVKCAYCSDSCASLESLQVHILTECHDAHARMEATDPAAAAKALNGISLKEHVSVKVPVAAPVRKSSAAAAPIPAVRASSLHDSSRSGVAVRARRSAAVVLSSDSEDSDDARGVTAADVRAASRLAAASSKPKAGAGSSAHASASPRDSDEEDALFASRLAGYHSASSRPSRTSAAAAGGSIKQQQRDLEASIAARRGTASATVGSATSSKARPTVASDGTAARSRSNAPGSSSSSSAASRSAGVSPAYGIGADALASASRSSKLNPNEDFERWMANLRSTHGLPPSPSLASPAPAGGLDGEAGRAGSTRASARAYDPLPLSSFSFARGAPGASGGALQYSSAYEPFAFGSSLHGSNSSSDAAGAAARSVRERPAFDRPLSIPKASSSGSSSYSNYGSGSSAIDLAGYGARPASPPSRQQAPGSGSISSHLNPTAPHSSAAYALPTRSALGAGVPSATSARTRVSSSVRSQSGAGSGAVSSAHTPQYTGAGSSPYRSSASGSARRSGGAGSEGAGRN